MATRTSSPTAPATSGALLVDFDSVIGQDRKPFDATKLGTTVTATVTVRSIDVLAGGHARGIVDGDGGYAIFYVARGFRIVLADVLKPGAKVKIRGAHELHGMIPTISIFAARAVDA
ncbi:hypothetical protein [Streptomyces pseudovenezuelae]|uniref:hypothetical protein n=1 Tax=Streptomyces pseudovenezuelae TaxID=67350 RepID=UPI0036E68181